MAMRADHVADTVTSDPAEGRIDPSGARFMKGVLIATPSAGVMWAVIILAARALLGL